jgi:hypothetical protein
VLIGGAGAGCRRSVPPSTRPVDAGGAVVPDAAPVPIAAAAIEALVARWQVAQNAGDHAAYRALYAEPFSGIRRFGTKVVTYDHAGWMKDRARMFRKPQHVEVTGLEIVAATAERATVRFTQEWSSGRFRDTGLKELVLRPAPDGLRIAREEMLRSVVLPSEAQGRFLHLVEGDVVLAKDAPESWSQGAPQQKPQRPGWVAGEVVVTYRQLRSDKVPANLLGWQARSVRLFGLTGQVCAATISELVPASALYTDGSMFSAYADEGRTPPSEREKAAAEWEAGRRLLVGRLTTTSGDCKGAVFARAAELPVPVISKFEPARPPWRAVALRLLRRHPLYAEIQASWLRYLAHEDLDLSAPAGAERPEWLHKRWDGPDKPLDKWSGEVKVARHPLRDSTLLSVLAERSTDPDTLVGTMWALWEATGEPPSPKVVPMNQPARSRSIEPLAALDLDGDGRLELVNRYGVLSASAAEPLAYERKDYLDLPKEFSCYAGENDWDDLLGGPQETH